MGKIPANLSMARRRSPRLLRETKDDIVVEIKREDLPQETKRRRVSSSEDQVTSLKQTNSKVTKSRDIASSHFTVPVNFGNNFQSVEASDVLPEHPPKWNLIYNEVVKMRSKIMTPVDSMGCEKMPDTLSPKLSLKQPRLYRFQLLISLMLSSQTKDEINHEAMQMLKLHFVAKGYEHGICIEAVLDSSESEIDKCIERVGFHRRKAKYIKKACELLRSDYDDDVPKTIEDVVRMPGVGPKMGYLLLQFGWGINSGIGVDVHIHRLAQKWGWVRKSDKPEVTRSELEAWLPRRFWAQINPLLVGFGQTVCNSQVSNCDVCTLASANLCKGVNRKLLGKEMDKARLEKLKKQRGDLTVLIELIKSEA